MRRFLKGLGKFFWRFMIIFSFIVNVVLVVVVAALLLLIFDIKNNIAQPLVTGLHSSFIGLNQATIDWTIPVREQVPVNLIVPVDNKTAQVSLTDNVPLTVVAYISAPGLTVSNATVSLTLPRGTILPVEIDQLTVDVIDEIPVNLDVRAVIPLEGTQLHDVAENLRLLFEPLAVGLTNLPNNFSEVGPFVGDVLAGNANLLKANAYTAQPWPGFSTTAGLNYPLELLTAPIPENNVPVETGIVPLGGIPALDEQLRPEVYAQGGPLEVNTNAVNGFSAQAASGRGIAPYFFNGGFAAYLESLRTTRQPPNTSGTGDTTPPPDTSGSLSSSSTTDQGILPTPTPSGG
jgi:hypothetical protein